MAHVTATDGTRLHVKDWGEGRPVVLIHGWPLNSDSWEYQSLRLAEAGYRIVSYDRRGFGRSEQPFAGYDYDNLADDLGQIIDQRDLDDVTLVGFSMGGGEVARYLGAKGSGAVRQAVFVSSVAPGMLKSAENPDGVPQEVFDGMKQGLRGDRPEFLSSFFEDFYGNGTDAGGVSDGILHWSLMMAMMASPKATLDCVDAFGTTDFSADAAKIDVPTLIVHGTGDATVPIDPSARRLHGMVVGSTLREYDGAPHGLTATHADRLCRDLLDFLAS